MHSLRNKESTVAERLGTWNPEVAGSSPALTTKLELFLGCDEDGEDYKDDVQPLGHACK